MGRSLGGTFWRGAALGSTHKQLHHPNLIHPILTLLTCATLVPFVVVVSGRTVAYFVFKMLTNVFNNFSEKHLARVADQRAVWAQARAAKKDAAAALSSANSQP